MTEHCTRSLGRDAQNRGINNPVTGDASKSVRSGLDPAHTLLVALVIIVAGSAAYFNSLQGPFVGDDPFSITFNKSVHVLSDLKAVLNPPLNNTLSGRPVASLSIAVNYAMAGNHVLFYHVTNLLIHLASALLLFGVVRRSLLSKPLSPRYGDVAVYLAAATALIWTIHPLQTGSVTYIIQRCESLATLFYLLTIYLFLRGGGARGPLCLAGSVLAAFLSAGTKATAASLPLVVLLFDRALISGDFRKALSRRPAYYLALASSWLFLGYLVSTIDHMGGIGNIHPWWKYAASQLYAIPTYIKLSFWPAPLIFDYGSALFQVGLGIIPYGLAVFALIAATGWGLLKNNPLALAGAVFFGVLAPTSNFIVTGQVMAEHRMYLPLASVLLICVLAFYWLKERYRLSNRLAICALALTAATLLALTMQRNEDYRSELSLLKDTAEKVPGNPRVHYYLAVSYLRSGAFGEGGSHFETAVGLNPDSELAVELVMTLLREGKMLEGEFLANLALSTWPDARHVNLLGVAQAMQGKNEEAAGTFAEAVRLAPDSANYRENLRKARLSAVRSQSER